MPLEYLENFGKALEADNELRINRILLAHFDVDEMLPVERALILPAAHMRLARSYLNTNCLKEAFHHLEQAEIEGELLLSEYSLVRQEIYLIYAYIYLKVEDFDLCSSYLSQAEKIARMNLSRSSPSSLGCVYLLRELATILQDNADSKSYLPLARTAFLRTQNYIDVPKVAFVLSNVCEIHRKYQNNLNSSVRAKLKQFLIEAFQICRFENILEGKSPENRYRMLLNYVQQIDTPQAGNTQSEQRGKRQNIVSDIVKKFNVNAERQVKQQEERKDE
jgi:hypothetical protein